MTPKTEQTITRPRACRASFTLIELLIVIAIIAILATVVILALNPAELLRQARDSNRVSDVSNINEALTLYSEDVGGDMGSSSVVYVSVPDPTATTTAGTDCTGIGLASSSLPSGWHWHCAASSTYRSVNGTGWIPVDFQKMSSGSPMGSLPVDPVNATTSGLYYAYVVNGDPWEITANMESQKYGMGGSHDVVSMDGGQYPDLYEVGTGLSLMPIDYNPSLVGYWKLDEGSGTIAYDSSGHGDNGSWSGIQAGTSGYYSSGHDQTWAGYFDGSTDYVSASKATIPSSNFTISFWFYMNEDAVTLGHHQPFLWGISNNSFVMYQHPVNDYFYFYGSNSSARYLAWHPSAGVWHHLACSVTSGGSSTSNYQAICYGDGSLLTLSQSGYFLSTTGIDIGLYGSSHFYGLIDNFRIYDRALSAAEIQTLYNTEE